jgi:uncharacterized protein YjbJ (UPF0337 family)
MVLPSHLIKEYRMSDKDRIEGAADKIEGDIKEGVGELTGDRKLEAEGKVDRVKGDIKDGIADVKDKVDDVKDKVDDLFHKKDK